MVFLTPEGAEEYAATPVEEPGAGSADFSSPLAGEVTTRQIYATHVDTLHLCMPGYWRSCVIEALSAAKERARNAGDSFVRSGPWAFEVQRIGARPFFDFLLTSPFASIKVNARGGEVAAFAELRSKALAALGPFSAGREIQLMVSRWMEGQMGVPARAKVSRLDLAANFDQRLLNLDGGQLGAFVTRSRARATWSAAEPVAWPRCEMSDLVRARAIKAIEEASTIEQARKAVFRALAAPTCKFSSTFEGVQEEHLLDAVYHRGRRFSGHSFAMGGDCSARIYDKTLEAKKKRITWILSWLRDGGWDEETPVHRLEFQLRTKAIRQFVTMDDSLSGRDMAAVLEGADGIWAALTGRDGAGRKRGWLTLRERGSSPQATRWPVHQGWRHLQDARWYANRPEARRFNRDYIPKALRGGFRRASPITGAAAALRGPLKDQALRKREQTAAQIRGLAAAYVAAGVAAGVAEEPASQREAEMAISGALSEVVAGAEDPQGKITESIDLTYFRAAHQLLEAH